MARDASPPLAALIPVARIRTRPDAEDRASVIRTLLETFVASGALDAGRLEEAVRQIDEREAVGSTAIGGGVAVPHARVGFVSGPVVGYALLESGTGFRPLDGGEVRHVFVLLAPLAADGEHVAVLKRITAFARSEVHRKALSGCADPEAVAGVFQDYD